MKRHVDHMLLVVNGGDLKKQTCKMQSAESQFPNYSGTRLGAKKHPTTWCRRKLECNSLSYRKGCSPEGEDWPQQYLEGSCALNQRKEELIFLSLPNIGMLSETLPEKK